MKLVLGSVNYHEVDAVVPVYNWMLSISFLRKGTNITTTIK